MQFPNSFLRQLKHPSQRWVQVLKGIFMQASRNRKDPLIKSDQDSKPRAFRQEFESLLGAADAASLLNLHPVTLLRWAREGRLPHLRLGRKVMFRASELNAWCNSQQQVQAVCAA